MIFKILSVKTSFRMEMSPCVQSLFRRGFQTEENIKNTKSFQTGIPDRRKRKKSKVFSDEDFRQGET